MLLNHKTMLKNCFPQLFDAKTYTWVQYPVLHKYCIFYLYSSCASWCRFSWELGAIFPLENPAWPQLYRKSGGSWAQTQLYPHNFNEPSVIQLLQHRKAWQSILNILKWNAKEKSSPEYFNSRCWILKKDCSIFDHRLKTNAYWEFIAGEGDWLLTPGHCSKQYLTNIKPKKTYFKMDTSILGVSVLYSESYQAF